MMASTLFHDLTTLALNWTAAYLVHSTLLLLLVWATTRLLRDRRVALQEMLWRGALFGALVTASLQVGAPLALTEVQTAPTLAELSALPSESAPALAAMPVTGLPATVTVPEAARSGVSLPQWAAWFFMALWGVGAAWGLARLCIAARRLAARVRGAQPLVQGPLAGFLARLAYSMKLAGRVDLLASSRVAAPFAAGLRRRRIVLPSEALQRLAANQQESLVAHEAAHHARRDPAWLLASLLVERVFFFQPLNRVARVHLQECAELLADEHAARHVGSGDELASCLVEVAGWRSGLVEAAPVIGAGSSPRTLTRRVERLLSGRRGGGRAAAWPIVLALLAAIALVPSVSWSLAREEPAEPAAPPVDPVDVPVPAPAPQAAPEASPEPPAPPVAVARAPRAPEPEALVGSVPAAAVSPEEKAKIEHLTQEYKLRTQELVKKEQELRQRIEELVARANEENDAEFKSRIVELQSELESLRARRLEEQAAFSRKAGELGLRVVVRERAREQERARRAYEAAVAAESRRLATTTRSAERLASERARLEAEIAMLKQREAELKQRLEQLARKEEEKRRTLEETE